MQVQKADTRTRKGGSALRLVLWLLAAISLGDLAPAAAEFLRGAGSKAAADSCACIPGQTAVVDEQRLPPMALPAAESAVDNDEGRNAAGLPHHGQTPAPDGIVAAQLPDGQPSTAFNSRAPPFPA